ncbi:MAG: (Fe-S)-binding protein [Nitrospirae bacterium]|nr:MAG: (Fe-S)-binding protein [Nitrospirota bacterium]
MRKKIRFKDISKLTDEPLCRLTLEDLMPLPFIEDEPPFNPTPPALAEKYDLSYDGYTPLGIPKPKNEQEKKRLVDGFFRGFEKLLDPDNNWTFLQAFKLSLDYCVQCQTCSEQCHFYLASGKQEIYRPTFRSEILRRIYKRYYTPAGKLLKSFIGADIEVNYKTVIRLLESAYRCSLCRRCAQACPVGIDNGLISREIRKLFSQELGIAPEAIYKNGTRKHLRDGSPAGMTKEGLKNIIEFMEEDIHEKTGKKIKIPLDKKGADILLLGNAGEFISWVENPEAFAILFDAAGIDYTFSSEALTIDGVNYGLYFDDVELARIALRQLKIAKDLGVNKIVIGECGHAHKAFCVVTDRIFPGDLSLSEIPRESCFPLLWDIVKSGVIKFDPYKNDFPTTLQDACNYVRLMGIVQPQRNVIKAVTPPNSFREMEPHGVHNYCCGGGSGFGIMHSYNFSEWREKVSIRMKAKQVLEAFSNVISPDIRKMVIAPCSNCKGSMREIFGHYGIGEKFNVQYTGLVELMVNAMADLPEPYIEWEEE